MEPGDRRSAARGRSKLLTLRDRSTRRRRVAERRSARCVAIAAATLLAPANAAAQAPQPAPIVVLPFDNPSQDARLAWMREGAAILLSEMLMSSGETVIDREERLQAFDRLQLPAAAALSRASAIKVGQAVTAAAVVSGTRGDGGRSIGRARARACASTPAGCCREVEARGPHRGSVRHLRDGWRRRCADRTCRRRRLAIDCRRSPQVFELYVKGLIAERRRRRWRFSIRR